MGRKEFLDSLKVNNNSEKYTSKKLNFNKLKRSVKLRIVRGLLVLTILGCTGCGSKESKEPVTPTPVGSLVDNNKESSEYEHLDTFEDVLHDFKERYIKEYNEVNGTNICAEDIKLNNSSTNYLYTINGKYVTHGSKPYETENVLKEVGSYGNVCGNISLYQIIDKTTGKALETYAYGLCDNNTFVKSPVYSGNDLSTLKEKLTSTNTLSVLAKYLDGFDIILDTPSNSPLSNEDKGAYIDFVENLYDKVNNIEDYDR